MTLQFCCRIIGALLQTLSKEEVAIQDNEVCLRLVNWKQSIFWLSCRIVKGNSLLQKDSEETKKKELKHYSWRTVLNEYVPRSVSVYKGLRYLQLLTLIILWLLICILHKHWECPMLGYKWAQFIDKRHRTR